MKIIYLDNAATTKPSEKAIAAMVSTGEHFGNPSSLHGLGLETEKLIEAARKTIAQKSGADAKGILFTSGGTEANNTAIFGVARARKKTGTRIITSKTEHPSVLEAFKQLEKEDFEVIYIDALADGRINIEQLKNALNDNTTLVSIMHVNNETGVINPIPEIKTIIKEYAPNAYLHSDCVQSFGKIDTKNLGADLMTISAHKIHGFKGTGALYVKDFRMIRPLLYGGEQQHTMRPGTENVGGILAFAAAAEKTDTDNTRLIKLRNTLKEKLSVIPDIKFNGSDEYNSGSVLNASFVGIKAEILLHAFEARGVYVSTGSACSSHKPQPSHVLTAMGLNQQEIGGAVRISLDRWTTEEEITEAAEIMINEAAAIKRYM